MATFYNDLQKDICNSIIAQGRAIEALQQQLALERQVIANHRIKIRQYEAITGISNKNLPHENTSDEKIRKLFPLKVSE